MPFLLSLRPLWRCPMTEGHPIRQKSANGTPKPTTSIERTCATCRASFGGLAPGKTGERGIWQGWFWYCSLECAPERVKEGAR
jgi:hypothetical protein